MDRCIIPEWERILDDSDRATRKGVDYSDRHQVATAPCQGDSDWRLAHLECDRASPAGGAGCRPASLTGGAALGCSHTEVAFFPFSSSLGSSRLYFQAFCGARPDGSKRTGHVSFEAFGYAKVWRFMPCTGAPCLSAMADRVLLHLPRICCRGVSDLVFASMLSVPASKSRSVPSQRCKSSCRCAGVDSVRLKGFSARPVRPIVVEGVV